LVKKCFVNLTNNVINFYLMLLLNKQLMGHHNQLAGQLHEQDDL